MIAIIAAIVVVIVVVAVVVVVVEEKRPTTTTSKDVEFYTWWATEGKVALDKLAPAFHNATGYTLQPYVSPGAGGSNAIYAILSLIEAGKPPATFQVHFGPAMLSYVEAAPNGINSFVNMGPVAEQMNLTNNSLPEVIEAGEFNGHLLSLPVDLHQGAQLYFNPQLLKKYNVPIPTNLSTLISDTKTLESDGVTPWIIPGGDGGWDQLNVWEDIFLALAGNKMYDEFMYGTLNMSNPTVANTINETSDIYSLFQNDSYSGEQSMTWTQAISEVTSGQVAFQVNGNWYTNYAYDFLNVTNYPAVAPYTSWTNISLMSEDFPNTSQYFVMVTDSVAVPTGSTQTAGLIFAKYFASWAGQMVFTKWKAVTFYDNVTTDYFNTPAQWYSYQLAKSTPGNDWVYQLSDGGLFAGPLASAESAMASFSESFTPSSSSSTFQGAVSVLDASLKQVLSSEEQQWMSANSLGLGYMGSPGHPFGGYLPPWANTSANATVTAHATSDYHTNSRNADNVQYVYMSPFGLSFLENMVTLAVPKA
ncbi:hypothetical protein GCM10007108_13750 [Thermogymnomonas acidicola]|uniref:Uncharacterized protein n=1 Tax=Thermogymnomonas acidicola TaxID=399579 RepID=A0AA37BS87_9ARCH|nr:glucose ABC transporter substrate-binding protein GlcS [Thermogymnomonas acidicola]GGM76895.1 hypothetical protein GCM10007108_13750 [Thermogymnomonas acidicola]